MLKLYQSLVRPKLEYCLQVWRPYLRNDIDLLEKVLKRATRLMINDRNLSYSERLNRLNITTLETRRLRQWRSKSLRGPGSTVTWRPSLSLPSIPPSSPSLPFPSSSPAQLLPCREAASKSS